MASVLLSPNDTASAFSNNLPPVYTPYSIVFWLFAIAALLLPVDIALRRLSSLEFLVVGYHWLLSHLGLRKVSGAKNSPDNLVLDTIRSHREDRKRRASSSKPKVTNTTTISATRSATPEIKKQQEATMAEKLLEAKRKRTFTKTEEELQ